MKKRNLAIIIFFYCFRVWTMHRLSLSEKKKEEKNHQNEVLWYYQLTSDVIYFSEILVRDDSVL